MDTITARRALVTQLAQAGHPRRAIADMLAAQGVTNPRTKKPYSQRTILNDLALSASAPKPVKELIGRVTFGKPLWSHNKVTAPSIDATRPDYVFWDRLWRGKAEGFEIGGLFAQPVAQILATYTLGIPPLVSLVESGDPDNPEDDRNYTDRLLASFMRVNHALLLRSQEDRFKLGDQFVIVNPDGSLSIPSPDTVEPEFDKIDYRRMVKCTIRTKLLDGTVVADEWRDDGRTVTVTKGSETVATEYENLIGRIPVVHFAQGRSANELYGHPYYEGMYRTWSRYDTLFEKALDGVEIVGNPIPVFEGMEDVDETIEANNTPSPESYTDPDGNQRDRTLIEFDTRSAIFVGKGGRFEFKAPQAGFTADIKSMLKMLFLLMCDHTRIPEFMFGGAVAQSKASTETQMPPFIRHIEGLQVEYAGQAADEALGIDARGGLYELVDVWLKTMRLTDPRVVAEPTQIQWADLTAEDAQIRLQKIIYADGKGYLKEETALEQLRIVPNAKREVEEAADRREQMQQEDDTFRRDLNRAAHQEVDPAENPAGGEPGYVALEKTA